MKKSVYLRSLCYKIFNKTIFIFEAQQNKKWTGPAQCGRRATPAPSQRCRKEKRMERGKSAEERRCKKRWCTHMHERHSLTSLSL